MPALPAAIRWAVPGWLRWRCGGPELPSLGGAGSSTAGRWRIGSPCCAAGAPPLCLAGACGRGAVAQCGAPCSLPQPLLAPRRRRFQTQADRFSVLLGQAVRNKLREQAVQNAMWGAARSWSNQQLGEMQSAVEQPSAQQAQQVHQSQQQQQQQQQGVGQGGGANGAGPSGAGPSSTAAAAEAGTSAGATRQPAAVMLGCLVALGFPTEQAAATVSAAELHALPCGLSVDRVAAAVRWLAAPDGRRRSGTACQAFALGPPAAGAAVRAGDVQRRALWAGGRQAALAGS